MSFNRTIFMIYLSHDGKEIQADQAGAGIDSETARDAPGGVGGHGGALGSRGQANSGTSRTCIKAASQKKTERGEIMARDKTGTPGIYKIIGKKGRVKYRLYINVQIQD